MSTNAPSLPTITDDKDNDSAAPADDSSEPSLLDLIRQRYQLDDGSRSSAALDTGVLSSASFICDNSIDVALDPRGTKAAAVRIWDSMQRKGYDRTAWGKHELHPSPRLADVGGIGSEGGDRGGGGVSGGGEREVVTGEKGDKEAEKEKEEREEKEKEKEKEEREEKEKEKEDREEKEKEKKDKEEDSSNNDDDNKNDNGEVQALGDSNKAEVAVSNEGETDTKKQEEDDTNSNSQREEISKGVSEEQVKETGWGADATLSFIFTLDLLNFCFWSEKSSEERFAIEYRGKRWTGYLSLVAALRRALDEEIPITTPSFWRDESQFDAEKFEYVFRSATEESIPLLTERLRILREASTILKEKFNDSVASLVSQANRSAAILVNTLAEHFPAFRDEAVFESRKVRFLKRAQIFVADLWAAFDAQGYGAFDDLDKITMFADYRVPQILFDMGCLMYSPPLESQIRRMTEIESGCSWEIQMRGCSIWCVEMLRREIVRQHPEANVNAILIDFFLYDTMKEKESAGEEGIIPHHRTRSIWY